MSYPVYNLIENRDEPLSVYKSTPLFTVLKEMSDNDYSQLPVISEAKQPIGMVTYQSIIKASSHLDCKVEDLCVEDVCESLNKTQIYRTEDDLFDMLDHLRDTKAILIVDANNELIGIVTTYDATEYFRTRAEDLMYVQDIEMTIKDLILDAFKNEDEELDSSKLDSAIEKISSSKHTSIKEFAKALNNYLSLEGITPRNQSAIEASYQMYLQPSSNDTAFSDLSLHDYIELLLYPDQNAYIEQVFNHPRSRIRKLLHGIRDTRNDLAHFREITSSQREQIHYCNNLLNKTTIAIPINLPPSNANEDDNLARAIKDYPKKPQRQQTTEIIPIGEEISPTDSKYLPLVGVLCSLSPEQDKIIFTFNDVNDILEGGLPPSARSHRAWWANDSVGHVHSQLWLDEGWRTSQINMTEETVVFTRIAEMEKNYIQFFNELLASLSSSEVLIKDNVPNNGRSWMVIHEFPEDGPKAARFGYAFSSNHQFRIEMYIDDGNREHNKGIFDRLCSQESVIEKSINQKLSWERINKKRACRIAVYRPGHISDPEEKLEELKDWALTSMVRFYETFKPITEELIREINGEPVY